MMKLTKKIAALGVAILAVCMVFTSCSSRQENVGVANEKNMVIESAEDLEGKAVGVQLRSAVDEYLVENKLTDFPRRYENLENAVTDLTDKKIAAMITDANYARKLVGDNENLTIVDGSIGSVDYRFLFSKADEALAAQFNEQIAAFKTSADYTSMVETELVKGENFATNTDKELTEIVTLATETYFKPFAYDDDGVVRGFFAAASDNLAKSCGLRLEITAVEPNGASAAVAKSERTFCVVTATSEDENFVTTDPFYTSELVMIIRTPEKK